MVPGVLATRTLPTGWREAPVPQSGSGKKPLRQVFLRDLCGHLTVAASDQSALPDETFSKSPRPYSVVPVLPDNLALPQPTSGSGYHQVQFELIASATDWE